MDTRPLIIGSKFNEHKGKNGGNKGKDGSKQAYKPKSPPELVDVYVLEKFAKTVPLRQLVRYSKVAATAFPKPPHTSDDGKAVHAVQAGAVEKGGEADSEGNKADVSGGMAGMKGGQEKSMDEKADLEGAKAGVNGLTAQVSGLALITNNSLAAQAGEEKKVAATGSSSQNKVLILGISDVREQPTVHAITYCINWIISNKDKRYDERLVDFVVPKVENVTLTELIELQAAVLSFDLRPSPAALREEIMHRLTFEGPLQADVQHIFQHLPMTNSIFKRTVTAFFEHAEADHYTDEEYGAIFEYVEGVPALSQRFYEVEQVRERSRKRQEREQQPRRQEHKVNGKAQMMTTSTVPQKKNNVTNKPTGTQTQTSKTTGESQVKPKAERWQEAERKAAEVASKAR